MELRGTWIGVIMMVWASAWAASEDVPLPGLPDQAASEAASSFGTPNDPVFQNLMKKTFPLSPAQVQALRHYFETAQRAAAAPYKVPVPTVSNKPVSLEPGAVPPVLRMATGYVSSVVFLDETGSPWPIEAYDLGDPNAFRVQWDQTSNVLLIQGAGPYSTGNLAVRLSKLNVPVMLTLVSDQEQVDYRVDLRVMGRGPKASSRWTGHPHPEHPGPMMASLLDGVPPDAATRLTVTPDKAQAWLHAGRLYVRTPLVLLSPGWDATVSSADGTHVYAMRPTPMLLASESGRTVRIKVEGL